MTSKDRPTIELNQTITLALTVTDRQASAQWYEQHLGFQTAFASDEMGWTELHTNTAGVTLGLGESDSPSPGNCVPVFGVASVDDAHAALKAAGIQFDGDVIHYEGMVKLATFFDPDKNALMIAEDLTQS
ncbi:MAG: VOC family protein [Burkholderiaceae bacterium]